LFKKLSFFIMVALLLFVLIACGGSPAQTSRPSVPSGSTIVTETPSYNLSSFVNDYYFGNIIKTPDATSFKAGNIITLNASPNTGYEFAYWIIPNEVRLTYGATSTSIIRIRMPTQNATVTAIFREKFIPKYFLSISQDPFYEYSGIVSESAYHEAGSYVTLTATSIYGYEFVNWVVPEEVQLTQWATTTNRTIDVIMPTQDATVTAVFRDIVPLAYYLSVLTEPYYSGIASGSGFYLANAYVSLAATPNYGYEFVNWIIPDEVQLTYGATTTNRFLEFLMPTQNATVTAVFRESY